MESDQAQKVKEALETLQLVKRLRPQVEAQDKKRSELIKASAICEKRLGDEHVTEAYRGTIEEFTCPICRHILEDMIMCSECEALFCEECMAQWLKQYSTSCPNCKRQLFNKVKAPNLLRRMLDNTVFNCQYREDGCMGKFSFSDRQQHYKNDCIVAMKAANECPFGCGEQIQPSYTVQDHVMTTCSSDEFCCPRCKINIYRLYSESEELYDKHEGHSCLKDLFRQNELLRSQTNDCLIVRNRELQEKIDGYSRFKFPVIVPLQNLQLISNTGFDGQLLIQIKLAFCTLLSRHYLQLSDLSLNIMTYVKSKQPLTSKWFVEVRPIALDSAVCFQFDQNKKKELIFHFTSNDQEYRLHIARTQAPPEIDAQGEDLLSDGSGMSDLYGEDNL